MEASFAIHRNDAVVVNIVSETSSEIRELWGDDLHNLAAGG
jgi:hypothetical protein